MDSSQNTNQTDILKTFKNSMTIRPKTSDVYLVEVLVGLLSRYFQRVPDAAKVFSLMKNRGDTIFNDHIAFRAFELTSLLKVFLPYDYKIKFLNQDKQIPFNFESKKLTAVWLKHPNPDMPRIFISECRLDEFPELTSIITPYLDKKNDFVDDLDFKDTDSVINYLHTPLWPTPSYEDYQKLSESSEYLGWVFFNKYYLNHFTLSIHNLTTFDYDKLVLSVINNFKKEGDIKAFSLALKSAYKQIMTSFNQYLKDNGLVMNSPNNKELNISPDELLLQSSTKAQMIDGTFPNGTHSIPGSYVEFAYRGLCDEAVESIMNGKKDFSKITSVDLKDGFDVANADKIFESTYMRASDSSNIENDRSFIKSKDALLSFLNAYQNEHPELYIF
jgi:hypothetical protein